MELSGCHRVILAGLSELLALIGVGLGGGLPVVVDGQCVGAIGCSTGTPAQDQEVAQAGLDAIMKMVGGEGGGSKAKL